MKTVRNSSILLACLLMTMLGAAPASAQGWGYHHGWHRYHVWRNHHWAWVYHPAGWVVPDAWVGPRYRHRWHRHW